MVKHQEHFGRKFYQDQKTKYWISTNYPRIRAHRWVWISIHGPIPPGYHIHHKDENRSNNDINNLELIEKSRHCRHHMQNEERKEMSRKLAAKIRPLTKKWHGSPEGLAWHKYHAEKHNFGKWKKHVEICDQCGTKYETRNRSHARFCSNKCKSAWRRGAGLDNEDRICVSCGDKFTTNKYGKIKLCTIDCISKQRNKLYPEIKKMMESGIKKTKIGKILGIDRQAVNKILKNMESSRPRLE